MKFALGQISTITFRAKRNISLAQGANFTFAERKFHISPVAKYFIAMKALLSLLANGKPRVLSVLQGIRGD